MAFGVLVPIVVVAVGIFPFAHVLNRRAWDMSAAYDIARTELEQLRATDFDELPSSRTATEEHRGTVFTCTTTVTTQNSLLKKISVTVTWQLKKAESLQLDTLVAKTSQ